MKHTILFYFLFASILLFNACSQTSKETATDSSESFLTNEQDASRKIKKTSSAEIKVDSLAETLDTLGTSIQNLGGHIFHYEINSNKTNEERFSKTLDSTCVIEMYQPSAMLKVKVPSEKANSFISQLMRLDAQIENFQYDEEDLTTTENLIVAKTTVEKQNKANQTSELNHQTKYLWMDINIKANQYQKTTIKANDVSISEPFYMGITKSLQSGWFYLSKLLIAVLNLWPLVILTIIGFIIYKKYNSLKFSPTQSQKK